MEGYPSRGSETSNENWRFREKAAGDIGQVAVLIVTAGILEPSEPSFEEAKRTNERLLENADSRAKELGNLSFDLLGVHEPNAEHIDSDRIYTGYAK